MDDEEMKWLCEWIGCEFLAPTKHPRPKRNEEWMKKWERWNEDQHKKIGEMLNEA